MSDLVSPTDIERIVGAERHPVQHLARAVSANRRVYILHSRACLDSGIDLRDCEHSLALDRGIPMDKWCNVQDRALKVKVHDGLLVPTGVTEVSG